MDIKKLDKILKIVIRILFVFLIAIYAWSITPKTFQNDTFYTIKIGELIDKNTEHISDLLPWNKGLDMKDHFSYHNLPYTYPHWLYDFLTYKVYNAGGFQGIYILTCILAVVMGLLIYAVNIKLNKNRNISFFVTMGTLYCLRDFIAARAQLVTFILFVLTIYCLEQFIKSKKIRYGIILFIIATLIANLHCAVWPFFFILFAPYVAEYLFVAIRTTNYKYYIKKIKLNKNKKKISKEQYEEQKSNIQKQNIVHNKIVESRMKNTYKIELVKEKAGKWLILIMIICSFTGLLTPIKTTPYTYLIKTTQGNTTESISEHLPLTLAKNWDMIVVFAMVLGILIFSRAKIKLRDFFMLAGLIFLSFMTQRQTSMLVLIGNFIFARMLVNVVHNIGNYFTIKESEQCICSVIKSSMIMITIIFFSFLSFVGFRNKSKCQFISEKDYPIEAAEFIKNDIIPRIGKENLRLYNEYNYGSYLLFQDIPVFIDSRADLYAPEFNGKKNDKGKYVGNDIFSDFIGISNLSISYEMKFRSYGITHVVLYQGSKLGSLLLKDSDYSLIYSDQNFIIYERVNSYE